VTGPRSAMRASSHVAHEGGNPFPPGSIAETIAINCGIPRAPPIAEHASSSSAHVARVVFSLELELELALEVLASSVVGTIVGVFGMAPRVEEKRTFGHRRALSDTFGHLLELELAAHARGMDSKALLGLAVSFATVVVFLTLLELMRRRGVDPVARLADVVMPPRMAPSSDAPRLAAGDAAAAVETRATATA